MDVAVKLENRAINPAVINMFQFENQTTTLNFVLDSYMWENSDLRNYTPYVVTSVNGVIDMTELTATYNENTDKLSLAWTVGDYTLSEKGAVLYQIVFKENTLEGEIGEENVNNAVWYSYKAIMINRGSVDGDNHMSANYPTLLKQWLDKMNRMYGELTEIKDEAIADISKLAEDFGDSIIYIPFGQVEKNRIEGRLYYQWLDEAHTVGQFEDHLGNILIPDVDGLPEQTGMEGKYLTTDGETAYWMEAPRGLPLFGHIWSDHLFNDASYLRADTFSWHDGGVYVAAYNELEKEYNKGTEEVEGDIVFKRGENGYKICSADQEEALANLYAITGVAWYYIIDTANKRFKLPRKLSEALNLESTYPVMGNGMTLGLTEGTHNVGLYHDTTSGVIARQDRYGTDVGSSADTTATLDAYKSVGVTTDASKSGIIADLSSIGYKEATEYKYLYFYVGNYFRTQTEINIGEMAEKVNSLKVNNPFFLGMSQYFESEPNNDSWLKSDGEFHDGTVHKGFYDWLLSEYTTPKSLLNKVNANVVGSLVINDGVVSGFTAGDYLVSQFIPENIKSFEFSCKVNSGNITSTSFAALIGNDTTNRHSPQITIDNGSFWFGVSSDGSSWTSVKGGTPVANKDYWLKASWNGTQIELKVSEDGVVYTSLGTTLVSSVVWDEFFRIGDDNAANDHWLGSIDLNNLSLSIDGSLWWKGVDNAVKKSTELYNDYDFVINTTNNTFRLPNRTRDDYVVENYQDANNWYKVYRSGWVEQGGKTGDGSSAATVIVPLPKKMANMNYTIMTCFNSSSYREQSIGVIRTDLSTITLYHNANSNYMFWQVSGQGAETPDSRTYFYVGETVVGANIIDYTKQLTEATEEALTAISTYQQPLVTIAETSGTVNLAVNNIYTMVISGDTTFTLPETVNTNLFNQIKVMAKIVGTPVITWGTEYFVNKSQPELEAGCYDLYFDYDNHLAGWVVGAISKGA